MYEIIEGRGYVDVYIHLSLLVYTCLYVKDGKDYRRSVIIHKDKNRLFKRIDL